MPGLTQPLGVLWSLAFLGYLSLLSAHRILTLLIDEERLPSDWSSNFMRLAPLGAFVAIAALVFGMFALLLMGYYGERDDESLIFLRADKPTEVFQGTSEYVFALGIVAFIYAEKFRRTVSDDAGYVVGFVTWTVGILLSIPYRFLVYLFGFTSWFNLMPLLYIWTLSHPYLLKRFRVWRAEKEAEGSLTRNQTLEDFMNTLEWEMRWTRPVIYSTFTVWLLQIEAFLDMNEAGFGFALFYYVIIIWVISGCIEEYRVNDF